MKRRIGIQRIAFVSSLALSLWACGGDQAEPQTPDAVDQDGPAEEAGEWTDEAAEDVADETEEAVDETGEAIDEAEDEVDEEM